MGMFHRTQFDDEMTVKHPALGTEWRLDAGELLFLLATRWADPEARAREDGPRARLVVCDRCRDESGWHSVQDR